MPIREHEGVAGTRAILSTLEEVRAASLQVALSARRLLTMFTQDLERQVYDQPEFLETVKKLVLAQSYAKVRVLVANPGRATYDSSRFIGLARRITSHIEVRQVHAEYRSNHCAFLVADDRATVYRLQASRWDGIVDLDDGAIARRYLNFFDEIWFASAPSAESRALHI